jgi:hypothetical protein
MELTRDAVEFRAAAADGANTNGADAGEVVR